MAKPAPIPPPVSTVAPWQRSESVYLVGRSHIDAADALAIEMERKWGADRLRLLVAPVLRARFDAQRLKLNRAIDGGELEDVEREATRMCNAWRALDAAAIAAGRETLSPLIWEVAMANGKVAAIVRSKEDARHVAADGRKLEVFTLDEIGNLIQGYPILARIEKVFPGEAVITARVITDPLDEMNDDLPF